MHGTKLGFMRDILSEAKMFLRQNEVNHMEVPCYQEISVKNLYEDAMKDELLVKYLAHTRQDTLLERMTPRSRRSTSRRHGWRSYRSTLIIRVSA